MVREAKPQSLHEEVVEELGHQVEEHGPRGHIGFFNNFYLKLPSLGGRDFIERAFKEEDPEFVEKHFSVPLIDIGGEMVQKPREERLAQKLKQGYSEKYFLETGEALAKNVAKAIQASGIPEDVVKAYVERRFTDQTMTVEDIVENDTRILLPVWVALREMGYTNQDLRS